MRTLTARPFRSASLALALVGLIAPGALAQDAAPAASKDAPAAKTAQTTPATPQTAAKKAAETPQAAPRARGPRKLDTGFDLSKLRVPQAAPSASPFNVGATHPASSPDAHGHGAPGAPVPDGPTGVLEYGADTGTHDFGDLTQGDVRTTQFRVKSTGEHDLVISQIRPSCGCTVAKTMIVSGGEPTEYVLGAPLAAGTELEVTAKLDTKNKHGHMQSNINLFCNDPRGVVPLTLKANVQPFLIVEPITLNLGDLLASDTATGELKVRSEVVESFALTAEPAGVLGDELKIECVPDGPLVDGRAAAWTVKVTLGPNTPEGRRNFPLILKTDQVVPGAAAGPDGSPTVQQAMGSVFANVRGLISAEPRYLSFGMIKPGESKVASVRVTCLDEDFTLPDLKPVVLGFAGDFEFPDNYRTRVVEVEQGKAYDVELELFGLPEAAVTIRGRLVMEIGHATKEKVELTFSGVVRGNAPKPTPVRPKPIQPPVQGATQETNQGATPGDGDSHAGHDHAQGSQPK